MRRLPVALAATFLALTGSAIPLQSQDSAGFVRYDHAAIGAPRAIVSGDFNRDGFPDVALGGTTRASVGILLNHGLEPGDEGQQFKPLIEIPVGGGPFDMAVGDLNRDGWLDIAVANADSHALTILLNQRRSIPFASAYDIPIGENPRGLAIGDFNRDAIPDVIVTKYMGTTVDVLYGAGDGTFPTRRSLPAAANVQGVAAADFNRDGWTDAVTVSVSRVATYYYMHASGATRQDIPLAYASNVVTTGDFDRNGWIDAAVASTGGSAVEFLWRHAYGPQPAYGPVYSVASSPRGIDAADMNGDGWLDVVIAGRNTSMVSVLSRTASGSYEDAQYAAGIGARDVTLTDFSRDGRIDILTANEYSSSVSLLGNGTDRGWSGYAFEAVRLPIEFDARIFGVADFNANGTLDLVRRGYIYLDSATPSRQFLTSGVIDGTIGDFNLDGRMDVVFSTSSAFQGVGILRMFFGNGAGDVTGGPAISTNGLADLLRAVDMNLDGTLDLVMRVSSPGSPSRLETWEGRRDGTFAPVGRVDVSPRWIEVGHLNGDAVPDVAVAAASGVHVLFGDGTVAVHPAGTFGAETVWQSLGVAEMTSDGVTDLVLMEEGALDQYRTNEPVAVVIARGHGDGTFQAVSRTPLADPEPWRSTPGTLLLADLDHDGQVDVLTGGGQFLRGGGNLAEPQLFAVRGSTRMLAADVNADGLLDVLGVADASGLGGAVEIIMLNTRRTPAQNRAPVGVELPDLVQYPYMFPFEHADEPEISAGWRIFDPDLHAVRHRWVHQDGTVAATHPAGYAPPSGIRPGFYPMTFTADDYRGGIVTRNFTLEITPYKEAVFNPTRNSNLHGAWQAVSDSTANEGRRLWLPNVNAPKIQAPLAQPTDYVDVAFLADPTQEYKLWVRLKADGDYWANDSVYLQFSGASDAAGNPVYRIGTTAALPINLEECSNCGISGWGWEDDAWGAVDLHGVTLRFPEGGRQRLRIQAREDGVSIDTIVLSAEKYKTQRPGTAKNDTTRLQSTGPDMGTWWFAQR